MQMAGYTKLFNSILHSTIWSEPNETRILWITMLAMADKDGKVNASIPGLARMAGITVEQTQAGLERFMSPDEFSRTKDKDGIRIEEISGGWFLLNHPKYRALMSVEERKEYNRLKQQEHRKKVKPDVDPSLTVNDKPDSSALSAHSEAKADAVNTPKPPEPSALDGEKKDILPKSPEALAIAALFGRKPTTEWDEKEIKTFRKLVKRQVLTMEAMKSIEIYYRIERAKKEDGRHRRDLKTFLNNFDGELDRAKEAMPKNGANHEAWRAEWEPWLEVNAPDKSEYRDYQFAPEFLKTRFHNSRKA